MLLFTIFLIKKKSTLVRIRDLFRKHLDVLPTADFEFVVIAENVGWEIMSILAYRNNYTFDYNDTVVWCKT